MEPQVADRVVAGRYELSSLLGYGGMGDVWSATDTRLGRQVAVKLLRLSMAGDPVLRQRFEDEARAAALLVHPNVVQVFDTGEDEGTPFIVMELLPGVTLADQLRSGMDEDEVRLLAVELLRGLGAAHDAGIVHRDVKPGNALLAPDGSWKVTDFGIAKSLTGSASLTETGTLMGTLAYLAPERLSGEPASPGSDLYSLGVMLYEALAGSKPFDAPTPESLIMALREGERPRLLERAPHVDPGLAAVVDRALHPDPSVRYASASEMLSALMGKSPAGSALLDVSAPVTELLPSPPSQRSGGAATGPALPEAPSRRFRPWLLAPLLLVPLLFALLFVPGSSSDAPPLDPVLSPAVEGELGEALDELSREVSSPEVLG